MCKMYLLLNIITFWMPQAVNTGNGYTCCASNDSGQAYAANPQDNKSNIYQKNSNEVLNKQNKRCNSQACIS